MLPQKMYKWSSVLKEELSVTSRQGDAKAREKGRLRQILHVFSYMANLDDFFKM
jgi:hypothetical protein